MANKVQVASRATGDARQRIAEAVALLTDADARASNAMGVFMEPALRRQTLQAAKDAIDAALAIMSETVWPQAPDYDDPDHANDF